MRTMFSFTLVLLMLPLPLWAQQQAEMSLSGIEQPAQKKEAALSKEAKESIYSIAETDEFNYTLGTNDVVEIKVQSHPELSGMFPLNSEGKIQYEFAGDVAIGGMTRKAAEDKVKEVLSQFVINPKLVFKIVEYHSKSIYVIGQVAKPGKYYIRTKVVPVREAIIEAGMPIPGSAMHRARLITPSKMAKA